MLATGWQSFQDFIAAYAAGLHSVAEIVKIFGAVASFYALLKLRNIESRYLFRATIPGLIENIDNSLQAINEGLYDPEAYRLQTRKALNHLLADVKTVRRRVKGDSATAAKGVLVFMRRVGFEPYFWQRQVVAELTQEQLLELYGQGSLLVRLLTNELGDSVWSSK
jgi:hypothetical protein